MSRSTFFILLCAFVDLFSIKQAKRDRAVMVLYMVAYNRGFRPYHLYIRKRLSPLHLLWELLRPSNWRHNNSAI